MDPDRWSYCSPSGQFRYVTRQSVTGRMRQAGRVFLRDISGEFTVPLFQSHAYPYPGVATWPGSVHGLQNATAAIDIGSCGHRVAPSHRGLWPELDEGHAVAVSPHDATCASANIEHNISARHLSSVCRLHRDAPHRSSCSAACRDWRGTSTADGAQRHLHRWHRFSAPTGSRCVILAVGTGGIGAETASVGPSGCPAWPTLNP